MLVGTIITVCVIIGAFVFIAIDDARCRKDDKNGKK